MIDLGTLGGLECAASAINDLGQIAGTGQTDNGFHHAFLLTPESGEWVRDDNGDGANDLMTDLGMLKLRGSAASDLNNDAQVVGVAHRGTDRRNAVRKPFLWENGQMTDLNTITDSSTDIDSKVRSINNEGQIVTYGGYILLPIPAP